ncbi:MAG: translation initiation factor 2 [Gammaproteobacteria bacterium]
MTEDEIRNPKASNNDAVLQQQYLRAVGSFEGIVLGQIDVKNRLGDRLNYSIRAGLVILSLVALSILILLIMLSSQVNRISDVVVGMNKHFASVSVKMDSIKDNVIAMESQVALMSDIEEYTTIMNNEMERVTDNTQAMNSSVADIYQQFSDLRGMISDISVTIQHINGEVQYINYEMDRMSEPARTMNRFIPFP